MRKFLVAFATSLVLLLGVPTMASATSGRVSPITIRLVLQRTSVVAGRVIKGEAVITNHSSRAIEVRACAEDGWLDVGLSNRSYVYSPFSIAVACAPTIKLRPGIDRFPIAISTLYQACTKATPGFDLPRCRKTGAPPLPKGKYLTSVFMSGFPKNTHAPSKVMVTIN